MLTNTIKRQAFKTMIGTAVTQHWVASIHQNVERNKKSASMNFSNAGYKTYFENDKSSLYIHDKSRAIKEQ